MRVCVCVLVWNISDFVRFLVCYVLFNSAAVSGRDFGRQRCMYSGLVGRLLFAARAALLACVGGLTCLMCVCLRWFPALRSF